jgi:DsbC/DsbD-like thiol-disulfide interchange protein
MDAIARTAARPRRPRLGRTARALGLVAAALPATAGAMSGPPAENPESTVRLISPWAAAPAEGELWLGLAFITAPGWHVYWKNSGDAGYPPVVSFDPTPEIAAAELLYPAPERYELPGGLVSYGYEGEVVYPVRARLAAPGRERLAIAADLDYLVCEVECIPYSVRLTLDQPLAGPGRPAAEDPASAPLLAAWRDRLPAPPAALGLSTAGALDLSDPERPALEVTLDGAAAAGAAAPELFLETHELFTAGAPEVERTAGGLAFRVPVEWRAVPAALPASVELAWTVTGLAVDGGAIAGAAIEARQTVPATTLTGPALASAAAVSARAALVSAAWALGAVAALLAALACWGIFGPRAGRDLPAAGGGGDPRRRGALGFAALAAAVGFVYRLALDLPADALAAVELALLALALAAWVRRRAGRPAVRAAMLAAMLLAATAAVGLAARAAREDAAEPPAGRIAAGS